MKQDLTQLSRDELLALCQRQQSRRRPQVPEPEPEVWTGELVITPDMVEQIILANTEE